ncbi:MAG: transcription termination/antitermination protein NusG [Endomicrobia bacterium]|nr:transcription termination/antitermination protein NusG [Endomicrobiia bacterium]MCX7940936.1 transcription termination/antitermination protein NusG [Endomicrobiia bacterium]MDW8055663.1 transcription termination/antitermination protein NusG [Elusimicrobiota bacterium]
MSQQETTEKMQHSLTSTESGWYIVYCMVGKELDVKYRLEEKIKTTDGMEQKIFEVLVPEEEEIRIKKGEKTKLRKAVFKGYVYINMVLTPETYNFVRSVSGVKGFLGGANPQKMSEKEVNEIKALAEKLKGSAPKVVRKFDLGDTIRIIDGPFRHFTGVVEEINEEKGKLKVVVTLFGRPTSVELEFTQVEKV